MAKRSLSPLTAKGVLRSSWRLIFCFIAALGDHGNQISPSETLFLAGENVIFTLHCELGLGEQAKALVRNKCIPRKPWFVRVAWLSHTKQLYHRQSWELALNLSGRAIYSNKKQVIRRKGSHAEHCNSGGFINPPRSMLLR